MTILIDASVFCAYSNTVDVHHTKADSIIKDIVSNKYGLAITTDYIFDETVTVALRKAGKEVAIDIGKFLINSEIQLAKIDALVFENAWSIFQKTSALSFTDCTSIAFMKVYGIKSIATFDKEFKNIGWIDVVGL